MDRSLRCKHLRLCLILFALARVARAQDDGDSPLIAAGADFVDPVPEAEAAGDVSHYASSSVEEAGARERDVIDATPVGDDLFVDGATPQTQTDHSSGDQGDLGSDTPAAEYPAPMAAADAANTGGVDACQSGACAGSNEPVGEAAAVVEDQQPPPGYASSSVDAVDEPALAPTAVETELPEQLLLVQPPVELPDQQLEHPETPPADAAAPAAAAADMPQFHDETAAASSQEQASPADDTLTAPPMPSTPEDQESAALSTHTSAEEPPLPSSPTTTAVADSPTHQPPPTPAPSQDPAIAQSQFTCRVCGTHLFDASFHLPPGHVHGPRVVGHHPERLLGPEGVLYEVTEYAVPVGDEREGAGRDQPTFLAAAFDSAYNVRFGVAGGGVATDPLVPGHTQQRVVCSKCASAVGWHLAVPSQHKNAAAPALASPPAQQPHGTLPPPPTDQGPDFSSSYRVVEHEFSQEDALLDPALSVGSGSSCLLLNKGWWTFEVCHKKTVRQFHLEPDGKRGQDWSLGSYVETKPGQLERAVIEPAQLHRYFTSHIFRSGQMCDETHRGRSTEVQFLCCPEALARPAFIQSVKEPQTCRYVVEVCVPTLCVRVHQHQHEEAVGEGGGGAGVSHHHLGAGGDAGAGAAALGIDADPSPAPLPPTHQHGASGQHHHEGGRNEGRDAAVAVTSSDGPEAASVDNGDSSAAEGPAAPPPFFLVEWTSLLSDASEEMRELLRGAPIAGISPVRLI